MGNKCFRSRVQDEIPCPVESIAIPQVVKRSSLPGIVQDEISYPLQSIAIPRAVKRSSLTGTVQDEIFCPEERIVLLWAAKRSSLHRKISKNILREVCDYIDGDEWKLIAVQRGEIRYFDMATSQWQQLCALHREIDVDAGTTFTFITPTTIFVCGGEGQSCTCHVGRRAYMLQTNGIVQELPPMSEDRWGPGIVWDSGRKALYVFGGTVADCTCYTGSFLRASEMFLSNVWSPLPDMHQGRFNFNPCWYSRLVYLCGGGPYSVETYNPRSNTLALQEFTMPGYGDATAVVKCGMLTVVSENYIFKLQEGTVTSQKHKEYSPFSNCTPIVSGGMVYISSSGNDCCRCIDLITGKVRKEVELSKERF